MITVIIIIYKYLFEFTVGFPLEEVSLRYKDHMLLRISNVPFYLQVLIYRTLYDLGTSTRMCNVVTQHKQQPYVPRSNAATPYDYNCDKP